MAVSNQSSTKISYIVPVLNGAKYIHQCLEHILAEASPDDEIIVVDNGSTDNTMSIVRDFERVILLELPDRTISGTRNYGAKQATTDIFAFIDSDCLVCPGWRSAVVEQLGSSGVGAAGSIYDLPSSPTWVESACFSSRRKSKKPTHFLLGGNFVVHRTAFEEVGGFDENLITDEDSDLSLRLIQNGHVIMDYPAIRVIHLGNAKTLTQFYRKTKWHSTSILETMFAKSIDKPMIMTLLFMLSALWLIIAVPLSIVRPIHPLLVFVPLIAVPAMTAVYRVAERGNYLMVFQLFLIYFVFYLARSTVILESIFGSNKSATHHTDESRGK